MAIDFDGDWAALLLRIPLSGIARELAAHTQLLGYQPACNHLSLAVAADSAALAKSYAVDALQRGLSANFGPSLQVSIFLKEMAGESGLADQLREIAKNMNPDTEMRVDAIYTPLEISRSEPIH